ncbi:MATE family efflux transporter [Sphingomonas canadensis]|uniref:MATE family efflux transporter n=1 Tax=Sphingomonas canadensis TaxID=1219257 RepID=A0ABW3H051_9SPHN|nr:MATE family efflux transporter [Sphingomonas canadensis]MCW3835245.1 MATE family efflux transporter [Sphingomonas canadensis]
MSTALPLTRRSIFAQAWPIMLGQVTVPLVGLVDTAVIGRTGDAAALAGVALGATIINFIFWSFGFLRMGMTGMTAQAQGAGDRAEVDALLVRGLAVGAGVGMLLLAAQLLLIPAAFALLAGGPEVDANARAFVGARFLGAPACLALYAINGWLLGLGRSRAALALQIVWNLANALLDMLFVWHFDMGARGVGLGTAIAEWVALAVGLAIVGGHLRTAGRRRLLDGAAIRRLFAVNADIMLRTVALLALFAWLASAGARLGAETLAANQVLLQFVSIVAFVLDGFAFTAESRVGQAIGARDRPAMLRAIRLTGEFSLAAAILFSVAILAAGGAGIALMTTDAQVRATAGAMLPFVALLPLLGAPAWLLDGVFIGATAGRALRNAALASTGLYVASDLLLRPLGETGLWIAFLASYVYRAGALGLCVPGLLRSLAEPAPRT